MSNSDIKDSKTLKKLAKQSRLAEELKANLKKRKMLMRSKKEKDTDTSE